MLQFIVLGVVPGTHLQITFSWVLLLMALVGTVVLWKLESPRLTKWWNEHIKPSDLTTN